MERSSLRRLTSLVILVAGFVGADAALDSYGSNYAAPVRTPMAAVLLTGALVGVRRALLGAVGLAGAVQAILCLLGAVASFDRNGLGLGLGGALVAIGVGYSALAFDLVRRGAAPVLMSVGLGLPLVAGALRIAAYVPGGSENLMSLSAALLALFAGALAWLAYRLWPEDLVVELRGPVTKS